MKKKVSSSERRRREEKREEEEEMWNGEEEERQWWKLQWQCNLYSVMISNINVSMTIMKNVVASILCRINENINGMKMILMQYYSIQWYQWRKYQYLSNINNDNDK